MKITSTLCLWSLIFSFLSEKFSSSNLSYQTKLLSQSVKIASSSQFNSCEPISALCWYYVYESGNRYSSLGDDFFFSFTTNFFFLAVCRYIACLFGMTNRKQKSFPFISGWRKVCHIYSELCFEWNLCSDNDVVIIIFIFVLLCCKVKCCSN